MRKLINDKKGFLPLVGLSAGVVAILVLGIILIVAGVLIFTSINKYAVIGVVAIVLTLMYGLQGNMNKTKAWFMGIVIVGALIFVLASGSLQSVFSVDQITTSVEGGKVYWTVFASASNIDEQYDFVKKLSKYTYSDGTTVTPQQQLAVLITEQDSYCEYSIIDGSYGLKVLSNPSKNIDLLVLDGNSGQSEILEGERADSVTINDPDGKGKLVVSSEGILERESRCPDYENVAIVQKDGKYIAVERDYLVNRRQNCLNFNWIQCIKDYVVNPPINTQFIGAFDSYEIISTKFTGRGLDLGEATFTIKADQDYFESVIYTPAKECEPEITSVSVSNEIKQSSSSSIKVNLKNNGDNSCKVTVVPTGNDISFSPNSREVTLGTSTSTSFTLSNGNNLGNKNINVEACFQGFTGEKCDTSSVSFNSIKSSTEPEEKCGDGVCQSYESYTTCPSDCEDKEDEAVCLWYQESYTTEKSDWKWYNYATAGLIKPEKYTQTGCKVSTGVYIILGFLTIIILGSVAIIVSKPKRKKRKK
ncbi:MAG: DUF2157 domain-containing protein [Nanoarchaeota archaeon]|nr:DUF2157 domain-containing protein [Nanoarchaeota archaeon]MBU1027902.1 DUF2157 domain-containing protein [Nanoarchaeota archaeon]